MLLHLYQKPALSIAKKNELLAIAQQKISSEIRDIKFNIEAGVPLETL